jgi:hypothetical protein
MGGSLASNAALFLLHSALSLIPGTSIPESHAGHLGVFRKTRTSHLATSGDGDGDFGETLREAFGNAGPSAVDARIGSCRAIFNSPGFLGCNGADSTGLFR